MRYLVSLVEQDASLGVAPSQPGDHLIQPAHEPPVLDMRADVGGSRGRENDNHPEEREKQRGKKATTPFQKTQDTCTGTQADTKRQAHRGGETHNQAE